MKRINSNYYFVLDLILILSDDKDWLKDTLVEIGDYLSNTLGLFLHPNKVFIDTLTSGVDFLGWVHFQKHRVLRTATKRKMFSKVNENNLISYEGMLSHGNAYNLKKRLQKL